MFTQNNVVLLGEGPLFWEVRDYLMDHNVHVFTIEDPLPESLRAVIDLQWQVQKKKEGLQALEALISDQVPIFTSVLHQTATEIASYLTNPDRVLGFSPLLLDKMKRLEICFPLQLEGQDCHSSLLFWKEMGKEIEIVGDEVALVFPRVLALLVNEAAFALSEGIASKEDIDLAMKKGTRYPFGPLEWADEIGIDLILAILEGLYNELREEKYRPAPLLRKMGYAGYFGQASGKGFYTYVRTPV